MAQFVQSSHTSSKFLTTRDELLPNGTTTTYVSKSAAKSETFSSWTLEGAEGLKDAGLEEQGSEALKPGFKSSFVLF